MEYKFPTINDIRAAREIVYRHLKPTPLYKYQTLCELVGTDIWIKLENHLPVGAFKVRGGLNLVANLTDHEKSNGLYTASTGNHGQSIAYSGKVYGVKTTIAVPNGANPGKVASMKGLGAKVIPHGNDFDEAREWIKNIASKRGGKFVSPIDDLLMHGVGTYALEILEELPAVDTIIVPVGAGSGVCATSIVAKAINKEIEIIAVQSSQAPAMKLSWEKDILIEAEMNTIAEGLATRVPFENTQLIMRKYINDFVLVDDTEIRSAVKIMIEHTHNLVEEAGAAPLAAALSIRKSLRDKNVVLVATGGNISIANLKEALSC